MLKALPALSVAALVLAGCAMTTETAASDPDNDPYLWLEEVEGERPLAQVREWNAETAAKLAGTPQFEAWKTRAEAILSDPERLALPYAVMGDHVTNFWTDAEHTHGLWRIAAVDDYLAGTPMWRTLLDLDALAEAEGVNWVWNGATCLPPDYDRCLVQLSDGGADKDTFREFDVSAGRFVEGGFHSTVAAKHLMGWFDENSIMLASDYGEGTLTESEFGRQVRLWRRGESIDEARVIYEMPETDFAIYPSLGRTNGKNYPTMLRAMTFWDYEYLHVRPDGSLVSVPMPATANLQEYFDGKAIFQLQEDWGQYPAGALVAYDIDALVERGEFGIEPVFSPQDGQSIQEVEAGADRLYVVLSEDVKDRIVALDRNWRVETVSQPDNAVIGIAAAGGKQDVAFFTVESFQLAPRLMATQSGGEPALVMAKTPAFDPESITVEQRFATSKDGTRIPYFVVRPAGAKGPLPTVMHAYGGFGGTQIPDYLINHPFRIGPMGLFWVEEGGSFVLANIRGGGEYGPDWHRSVLRENRQKTFDDLYAVGEDLKAANLTSTLAASGRSQGGLLVGVAYTQRPDLFDGIIMGVPLSDMYRYDKLLAGASWTGEYGDPDVPEDWAFISQYSPYQNLSPDADYPPVMMYTSTKDDRVHPGHARKMAARMEEYGQDFYYYENIEGGHFGAANAEEMAYRSALMMAYATEVLK